MEKGRFARVCMEMDLKHSMASRVWINDHRHDVEFESLHMICSSCDCYGHMARSRTISIAKEVVPEDQTTENGAAPPSHQARVAVNEAHANSFQKADTVDNENHGIIFKETSEKS